LTTLLVRYQDGTVNAELTYELLDAHADTALLARETDCLSDERWLAHLDYLQALQRVARAALARDAAQAPSSSAATWMRSATKAL
jgi:hypothetical protein